jgi:hypothetical protein
MIGTTAEMVGQWPLTFAFVDIFSSSEEIRRPGVCSDKAINSSQITNMQKRCQIKPAVHDLLT